MAITINQYIVTGNANILLSNGVSATMGLGSITIISA